MKTINLNGKYSRPVVTRGGRRGSKYDEWLDQFESLEQGKGISQPYTTEEEATKVLGGLRQRMHTRRHTNAEPFCKAQLYMLQDGDKYVVILGRPEICSELNFRSRSTTVTDDDQIDPDAFADLDLDGDEFA